ncbi:hypothetical protein WDU94_012246 [Cyamophila willieti]
MLGFISRSTKNFPDFLSFKILYCSLVRGVLEFASSVWNPSYSFHSGRIERIQHKALKTLGFKMRTPNESYEALEKTLDLLPLSIRREMYDMITFHKILHSALDTPDLLEGININAPRYYTRETLPFNPPYVRANYLQNSPLIRFQRSANKLREHLDLFSITSNQIRTFYSRQLES